MVDEAAVIIRPPIALAAGHLDKAQRTAIHLMFLRPPLGEYCASRSDSEGRIVVERQRCCQVQSHRTSGDSKGNDEGEYGVCRVR